MAVFFDYYVINTVLSAYRSGTITVVWNASANTVEFTDQSTNDLGGYTDGLTFSVAITSDNLELNVGISVDTWIVKIGARVL